MSAKLVSEIAPLYDSVVISQRLHGDEENVRGWFGGTPSRPNARPWDLFAATNVHSFFKDRTESTADLAYCNLQNAETMDTPYRLYSIGCRFWGPPSAFETVPKLALDGTNFPMLPWGEIDLDGALRLDDPYTVNSCMSQFWRGDAPRLATFRLIVEQDTIVEGPCMTFPPGHGITAAGSSWDGPVTGTTYIESDHADPGAETAGDRLMAQHPQMISVINQGNPVMGNRFHFVKYNEKAAKWLPAPIEIPKGALVECQVELSEYLQYYINNTYGPLYYLFNRRCPRRWWYDDPAVEDQDINTFFGMRYGITVSMMGERLVQQRGQYYAPSYVQPE